MTSVAQTLYRELHRAGRRIESRTLPANAAKVSKRLLLGSSSPRQRVRDAFAAGDGSPAAIDGAFAALRIAHHTLGWLQPNTQLHALAAASAPAEDGALVISELLTSHGAPAPQRELVRAELDRIATTAHELIGECELEQRERGLGPPTRLHKLSLINRAIFEVEQFQVCQTEPIVLNASLSEALSRRRGLPIVLCCIYHAVAARVGVPLAFTPFPRRLLLKLEPEEAQNGSAAAAAAAAGHFGGDEDEAMLLAAEDDAEVAELMGRLQRHDLETQLAMRRLVRQPHQPLNASSTPLGATSRADHPPPSQSIDNSLTRAATNAGRRARRAAGGGWPCGSRELSPRRVCRRRRCPPRATRGRSRRWTCAASGWPSMECTARRWWRWRWRLRPTATAAATTATAATTAATICPTTARWRARGCCTRAS